MARGKGGLGRGLDSLFEDAAPVFESEHAAVETLPLREIEPDLRVTVHTEPLHDARSYEDIEI